MPETPNGVAAVIVLYRPDETVELNIDAILPQVDLLVAVDNTESPDPSLSGRIASRSGVECVHMGGNKGIAAALNVGVERCEKLGYEWVVTMDQDSTPAPDMVRELVKCAHACDDRRIGVIGPVHQVQRGPAFEVFAGCRDELTVMTSGDLLNVEAWREVGRFDESLFIDQVDHDLCLRMHEKGMAVLTCGSATMLHSMGEMSRAWLLGPVYVSNHSPLRRYYITRNRLWALRRFGAAFPEFAQREKHSARQELLKILLFERQKLEKLQMIWRGRRDFARGASGPIGDHK